MSTNKHKTLTNSWSKQALKLLPKFSIPSQPNLFHFALRDMLGSHDPLITLVDTIHWDAFEESFVRYYSDKGRPAKPICLMVALTHARKHRKTYQRSYLR